MKSKTKILKLNAEWHKQNPMPENPTLDERIKWHIEHANIALVGSQMARSGRK